MINTTGRLLDYWLPPEGVGGPISAFASTFTFDPDFFEAECLSRFLGLDTARDEGIDLAFLINQEECLAESRVSVLVDRSYSSESRSLRWDLLPVGVTTGVLHAKISILTWDRLVRFVVSSANLVEGSYRTNVEGAVAIDAFDETQVPRSIIDGLLLAARAIVDRAGGRATTPGPKARALSTLRDVESRTAAMNLPSRFPDGIQAGVVLSGLGQSALGQLGAAWRGGPARRATILSPFFDKAGEGAALNALTEVMAKRGPAEVRFAIPVEAIEERTVVRLPEFFDRALPRRIGREVRSFLTPEETEARRLHAKALVFESDSWAAALVGSSNFTTPGLAPSGNGNLEVNIVIGAPARSRSARVIRELITIGEPIDLVGAEWEPLPDDSADVGASLPLGFTELLLEPGEHPKLLFRFNPSRLPREWFVMDPRSGTQMLTHAEWEGAGRPREQSIKLERDADPPFVVDVTWYEDETERRCGWAVNVTEPGKLPPPQELRGLPVRVLLRALASTRPIHDALAAAITAEHEHEMHGSEGDPELDPLKRYSGAGQLLIRAKQLSAALEGLRRRLERPAATMDTLAWRLDGPIGPRAVAEGLIREVDAGSEVKGETAFALAEVVLTLTRVDWTTATRRLPARRARRLIRETFNDIKSLRHQLDPDIDQRLEAYVERAFSTAAL